MPLIFLPTLKIADANLAQGLVHIVEKNVKNPLRQGPGLLNVRLRNKPQTPQRQKDVKQNHLESSFQSIGNASMADKEQVSGLARPALHR